MLKRIKFFTACMIVFISTSSSTSFCADNPSVEARSAILMDIRSGRVLYEKNAYNKQPIASTTKIMTAIVALENGNLDDVVTVSKNAANIRGSTIKLKENEKLVLLDLLYGLMLNSGNDAAIAIAEHIGGSVQNFVNMMNNKALELGLKDTNFITPHGLDMPNHYSTPHDLAIMTQFAMQNPVFVKLVSTKSISVANKSLYNTNELLGVYPGTIGVKTGYTSGAGRCLVASVARENLQLVSVVLNCPTRTKREQSSRKILNYGFENYKCRILMTKDAPLKQLLVKKGIKPYTTIIAPYNVEIPLSEQESKNLKTDVQILDVLNAPVQEGTRVGVMTYSLENEILAKVELKTTENINKKQFVDYGIDILHHWLRAVK